MLSCSNTTNIVIQTWLKHSY